LTFKKFLADSKMFEYDKHFRECQNLNRPFIKARKNPVDGNYMVQLDLITCDYNLTVNGQNNIEKLFKKENDYSKPSGKKPLLQGHNIDKELAWCDGILPERIDGFCEKLFDLSEESHV